jgi:hypothetical protein
VTATIKFEPFADFGGRLWYARHGHKFMGCHPSGSVPCVRPGVSRRSVYQMTTPIGKALGEGNCVRATVGGKEAGAKPARLRTETPYKAGSVGRVSQTSRSRSRLTDQVKGELVQRKLMFLSGETCQTACEPSFAPTSKHLRLKGWNRLKKFSLGEAGVSRGRITELRIPIETGRAKH